MGRCSRLRGPISPNLPRRRPLELLPLQSQQRPLATTPCPLAAPAAMRTRRLAATERRAGRLLRRMRWPTTLRRRCRCVQVWEGREAVANDVASSFSLCPSTPHSLPFTDAPRPSPQSLVVVTDTLARTPALWAPLNGLAAAPRPTSSLADGGAGGLWRGLVALTGGAAAPPPPPELTRIIHLRSALRAPEAVLLDAPAEAHAALAAEALTAMVSLLGAMHSAAAAGGGGGGDVAAAARAGISPQDLAVLLAREFECVKGDRMSCSSVHPHLPPPHQRTAPSCRASPPSTAPLPTRCTSQRPSCSAAPSARSPTLSMPSLSPRACSRAPRRRPATPSSSSSRRWGALRSRVCAAAAAAAQLPWPCPGAVPVRGGARGSAGDPPARLHGLKPPRRDVRAGAAEQAAYPTGCRLPRIPLGCPPRAAPPVEARLPRLRVRMHALRRDFHALQQAPPLPLLRRRRLRRLRRAPL